MTRRLNLAQAFNPIGSLFGMFVASKFILTALDSDKRNEMGELIFKSLDEVQKAVIRTHDLAIIRNPYVILGVVVIIMLGVISISKMPKRAKNDNPGSAINSFKRLIKNSKYREGVFAQAFYVGAQIMCWTYVYQYVDNINDTLGLELTATYFNVTAMIIFLTGRWIGTALMKTSTFKNCYSYSVLVQCFYVGVLF